MTAMHMIVGKSRLAAHLLEPHVQPGIRRKVSAVAIPLAELRRWRLDELIEAHRDLHEGRIAAPTPLELVDGR